MGQGQHTAAAYDTRQSTCAYYLQCKHTHTPAASTLQRCCFWVQSCSIYQCQIFYPSIIFPRIGTFQSCLSGMSYRLQHASNGVTQHHKGPKIEFQYLSYSSSYQTKLWISCPEDRSQCLLSVIGRSVGFKP